MGRILEYVVLLSNLSLILGAQQYVKHSQGTDYERERQGNFTHVARQHPPKDQNGFFQKKLLPPPDSQPLRRSSPPPKKMLSSVGLQAFASANLEWNHRRRNSSDSNPRFLDHSRRNLLSRGSHPRKNSKNFHDLDFPSQKLSRLNNHSNSLSHQTKRTDVFTRKYHHKDARSGRYHPKHSPKICDPCNSVPWVPLLKVSDSYRQQRTHITDLHPNPQQNFNFDYHAYASNTHNILLPPVPLAPPIYDGTISSSFGLPIGNIPTSHGLLAPINHLATDVAKYAINTIDYSNSFNYYSTHGLLENNNFPELSPVPIVPIHDSGQFYQFDSSVPDLVPPPTNKEVSNVVLTISEDQSQTDRLPANHKSPDAAPTSDSIAIAPHGSHSRAKQQDRTKDFGGLEIVQSIPLAEFTSSAAFHHQQQLPLYPPLRSEHSKDDSHHPKLDFNHSSPSFLVPPAKDTSFGSNKTADPSPEYLGQATAPRPLTSPSLSWLFSDHTAPPSESKNTPSASTFVTDTQEIASVVNNELRPVSSHPLLDASASEQSAVASKSKKVQQIIIPYTTKTKNEHDTSALESVQHEVFRPPVAESTNGNISPPPSSEANPSRKVTDRPEGQHDRRYLSEMHHIIASNIRELLRGEIAKSKKDQNYLLQNNIDNWTALEFSNHKTVGTKAPKEIIAQALAVTSIPGTSISHFLLPSKKIPNEYFGTTPIPVYDEPNTSAFKAENSSVNSRPFTAKPYATTNVYNPTWSPKESANHEKNYTDMARERVNIWGRLNENLVLPEARTRTRTIEQATTASAWTDSFFSSSVGSEKVQVVTPVPTTPQRNHTLSFRRTTRHARTTEAPTAAGKPSRKSLFLHRQNSTKLEKISKLTSSFDSSGARTPNGTVSGVERTNSTVAVEESGVGNVKGGQEGSRLSINDIFPFRNKELPWETSESSSSQAVVGTGRQRKSLIKQVNIQRSKVVAGSS